MPFDRTVFFNHVRESLFHGHMTQQQVDGMNFKMGAYEERVPPKTDLRYISYCFATSYHETSATMWPIEEYGKGKGQPYGEPDPTTGLLYYGRGDIQLTWADNYKFATSQLALTGGDDLYLHPERALDATISARVLMRGMYEGWFRKDGNGKVQNLPRYFSDTKNDSFGAREIVNGDKTKVPTWSGGVNIGNLIKGYHVKFLEAFETSWTEPSPEPVPPTDVPVVTITTTGKVTVILNGEQIA
jgi:hypothetical protein